MLKALIPKEEKYFDDFREMITHIQQMAKYTEQLFADELIDKNHSCFFRVTDFCHMK